MDTKLTEKKLRKLFLEELRKQDPILLGVLRDKRLLSKFLNKLITSYSIRKATYLKISDYIRDAYFIVFKNNKDCKMFIDTYLERDSILYSVSEDRYGKRNIVTEILEKLQTNNPILLEKLIEKKALNNYINYTIDFYHNLTIKRSIELSSAFNWEDTEEGEEFWKEIWLEV